MNTPHPELETLAELAEQAEPTGLDDARAHVAGCPACTAEIAALQGVQHTLRSLPDVAMPDDVTARLESALRAAAAADGASVSVLPQRPRSASGTRAGNRRMPHFSAAAAVTLLVVIALGTGIGLVVSNGGGGQSKSTAARSAASATDKTTFLASGHDYTKATIRNQVAKLVLIGVPAARDRYSGLQELAAGDAATAAQGSQPAAARPSASSSASSSTTFGTTSGPSRPAPTAPGGPLASSAALKACIIALVKQPVTPILVDYAIFEGKPATVIVLPDPDTPNLLDLYVEAYTDHCVANGDVSFFATLPATAP